MAGTISARSPGRLVRKSFKPSQRGIYLDRLSRRTNLQALEALNCDLTDADMPAFVAVVRNNPHLEFLNLGHNHFSAAALQSLANAAKGHPSLSRLEVHGNSISEEGTAQALADMLTHIPRLKSFNISKIAINDADCGIIANALSGAGELCTLNATKTCDTVESFDTIVQAISNHPHLSSANLHHPDLDDAELFASNLCKGDSKTLTVFSPRTEYTAAFCIHNRDRIQALVPLLGENLEQLSYAEIAAIAETWPRIRTGYLDQGHPAHCSTQKPITRQRAEFPEFIAALPLLPTSGAVEDLFTPDAKGFAPLDNPRIWRDTAAVFAYLDAAGQEWDDAFLNRRTPRGLSPLESFALAAPLHQSLPLLNAHNAYLQGNVLLQEDGSPTALLNGIIERGDGHKLFTVQNWKHGDVGMLWQVFDALPETQRGFVTNMSRLANALQRDAAVAAGR